MVLIKAVPSFYTDKQLAAYLEHIGLSALPRQPTLQTLNQIVREHIVHYAWENAAMHYTETGAVDITPAGLFERLVAQKQGGSYCYGLNTFMLEMLRAMGFRVYGTSGRVNITQSLDITFNQLSHMVLFVQIPPNSQQAPSTTSRPPTYIVDVGFGGGIVRPILLEENHVALGASLPEQHRVTRASLPCSSLDETDPESKALAARWFMQVNLDRQGKVLPDGTWRTLYEFGEQEFFREDFEALSFVIWSTQHGLFWDNVLAVIYTHLDEDTVGRKVMGRNKVTLREGSGYKILRELKTEADRIDALREEFFIQTEGFHKYVKKLALVDAADDNQVVAWLD